MTGLCSMCYKQSRSVTEVFPNQPNTQPLCKPCFKSYCNMEVPVYLAGKRSSRARSLSDFSNSAPHKVTGFRKQPNGTPDWSKAILAKQVDNAWDPPKGATYKMIIGGRCSRCQEDSNSLTDVFPNQPLAQPLCDACLETYSEMELSVYLSRSSTKARSFSPFAHSMAHKVMGFRKTAAESLDWSQPILIRQSLIDQETERARLENTHLTNASTVENKNSDASD